MLMRDTKRGGIRATNAMENDFPRTIGAFVKREPSCGFAIGSVGHARKISLKTATKSKGSFSFIGLPLPSLPRLLLCSVKIGAVNGASPLRAVSKSLS